MIFKTALKSLFVIFLTALNVNLTLGYSDYESGETSSSHETSVNYWQTYDVTQQTPVMHKDDDVYKESTEKVTAESGGLQYKFKESEKSTNSKPNNLNFVISIGVGNDKAYNKTDDVKETRGDFSPANDPKRVSELKCEEFGRAVGVKVYALHLAGTGLGGIPVSSDNTKCEGLHTRLIVGGTRAQAGEFPHMAALGWMVAGEVLYQCGGTLISERWILTAAHCTHGSLGSPTVVRLGAHILSNNTLGQVFDIKSIKRHPSYKAPAMYADIALLELHNSVTFKDNVRPACLHQQFDTAPSKAWATGWGITDIAEDTSDALLKISLNIVDNLRCARQYNRSASVPRGIVPSMLCAGDVSGDWKGDTCQGDSGGPLQVVHPTINCLYQIVGITSFGKLCALRESPGVYTRVSQYLNWIEGIVWPETV